MTTVKTKIILSLLGVVFLSGSLIMGADVQAVPGHLQFVLNNEKVEKLNLELNDIKRITWPASKISLSDTQNANITKRKADINQQKIRLKAENDRLLAEETDAYYKQKSPPSPSAAPVSLESGSDDEQEIKKLVKKTKASYADVKPKRIEFVAGNIVEQRNVGAIVNAANTSLVGYAGVAKTIQDKAGPELVRALRKLAPCAVGDAVITPAYNLTKTHSIDFVISAVGPNCNDSEQQRKSWQFLSDVYKRIYELAEENRLSSIAVVLMSIGIFGCLPDDSIATGIREAANALQKSTYLQTIRFVLFPGDQRFEELYQKSSFELMQQMGDNVYDLPAPDKGFYLELGS